MNSLFHGGSNAAFCGAQPPSPCLEPPLSSMELNWIDILGSRFGHLAAVEGSYALGAERPTKNVMQNKWRENIVAMSNALLHYSARLYWNRCQGNGITRLRRQVTREAGSVEMRCAEKLIRNTETVIPNVGRYRDVSSHWTLESTSDRRSAQWVLLSVRTYQLGIAGTDGLASMKPGAQRPVPKSAPRPPRKLRVPYNCA